MHNDYEDIRSRIAEAPSWHDDNGVPRYGAFRPEAVPSIYADEAALVEIGCQACRTRFRVAFHTSQGDRLMAAAMRRDTNPMAGPGLAEHIRGKTLHYGDPPNMGCCPAGPTMNSDPIRVLEYWRRGTWAENHMRWVRDPSLELPLDAAEEYDHDSES